MTSAATGRPVPPTAGRRQFALNAAASWGANIVKTLVQLALLPVMARLLGPAEFGVYALAQPAVFFFLVLADGGLGASLARVDERDTLVWSTAFWTLLGSCSAMAVLMAGSGFVLSAVTGQRELVGLMAFLSLSLPLLALSVTSDARLVRRGNLTFHSIGDLLSSIVGAGVAVSLAYAGAGAWALAAQYVCAFAVRVVVTNLVTRSLPTLEYDVRTLKEHAAVGGAIIGTRIGDLVAKFAEATLFGHFFGPTLLGTYTLASQSSRWICDAVVNPVSGAFYAHVLRDEADRSANLYGRVTRFMFATLVPATALLSILAPRILPVILGPKWVEAAPMVQALVLPYGIAAISWLAGQLMLARGLSALSMRVSLAFSALRLVALVGCASFGAVAVAWAMGVLFLAQALTMVVVLPDRLGVHRGSLLASLLPLLVSTAAASVIAGLVLEAVPGAILGCVVAGLAGSVSYLAISAVLDGGLLRETLSVVDLVRRRRPA